MCNEKTCEGCQFCSYFHWREKKQPLCLADGRAITLVTAACAEYCDRKGHSDFVKRCIRAWTTDTLTVIREVPAPFSPVGVIRKAATQAAIAQEVHCG